MATQTQINRWTDTVVEGLRNPVRNCPKKGPLTLAYAAIRGSGITHWPDVKKLGKQVLERLNARRTNARRKYPKPSEEAIRRANPYQ